MERLTERDHLGTAICKRSVSDYCNGKCDECDYDYDCFKKLADYEDLEEQGLLHIVPLKDGTPIWTIEEDYVDFGEKERYIVQRSYLHGVTEYEYGELDKDFFTDRDKAEQSINKNVSTDELELIADKWNAIGLPNYVSAEDIKKALELAKEKKYE